MMCDVVSTSNKGMASPPPHRGDRSGVAGWEPAARHDPSRVIVPPPSGAVKSPPTPPRVDFGRPARRADRGPIRGSMRRHAGGLGALVLVHLGQHQGAVADDLLADE